MSSIDDKFIVISQNGEKNIILNWADIDGKTVQEIREKYLKNNNILFYSNNLYSELLENSQKPSEIYPELALLEYPDQYLKPQNYLLIIDQDFDFSIKFQVVCHDNGPKIKFPALDVPFKKSNFTNCGDIFKYVSEKLTFPHLDDKFIQNSEEISFDRPSGELFEASKISPIYFYTNFNDSALKKIYYRQNILKEILSTETTYVNDLIVLIDYWKPAMKRSNFFNDQEITFFFGDLPNILKLHLQFKKMIEERGSEFDTFVSDIFIKFSSLFMVSKRFISTYAIFTYILNEKLQTNKNAASILQNLATARSDEGRDFQSFLITPVQRMPRYILFLRELLKYSPPEHPDFPYLNRAMESIVSVTQEIDRFSNSSRQIAQIMSNFSKPLFIFKEGRILIEKVTVYVNQSSAPFDQYSTGTLQNESAPKEGYFYLFNDSVLMTTIDQISSPKSKDSPGEYSKYPENPLFNKEFHEFKYFPHPDSIEFSFRDKRAKKGINHLLIYFKRRTDCIEFLEKLEEQRMSLKSMNYNDPWVVWKNKYFDLRPKIYSNQLNRQIKFTKILTSAYNQGSSLNVSENSEVFHFFFGGETRDKANCQLITLKDIGNQTVDIDFIENNSPNIQARSGHSICSDGTFIYIFGGKKSNSEFYDDLWKYSNETQTWERLIPHNNEKPLKRAYHACCYCELQNNKKIITVFGGLGEKKKIYDDIAMFDIDSCEWTVYDLFNSPNPRYLMGYTVYNETQLIIYGGRDDRYIFNDIYSFDLVNKMWKKITINGETIFPRFGHQIVNVGNYIVAIGGSAFEDVFVDHNSRRIKDDKNNSPNKKNSYTFYSLPPTAVNIETGNSFNIDEFGNAPQSLVGFGIVKIRNDDDNKINRFLIFGGLEDGINASRNSWFTIEIPSNLSELIEGIKPAENKVETENMEEQEEVTIPVNNEVISNTEEMIYANISEKFNDEIERQNLLIQEQKNKEKDKEENEINDLEIESNNKQIEQENNMTDKINKENDDIENEQENNLTKEINKENEHENNLIEEINKENEHENNLIEEINKENEQENNLTENIKEPEKNETQENKDNINENKESEKEKITTIQTEEYKSEQKLETSIDDNQESIDKISKNDSNQEIETEENISQTESQKTENEIESIDHSQIHSDEIESDKVKINDEEEEEIKEQPIQTEVNKKEEQRISNQQSNDDEIKLTQNEKQNTKDEEKINNKQEIKENRINQTEIKNDINQQEFQSEDDKKQQIQDEKSFSKDEEKIDQQIQDNNKLNEEESKDNNVNKKQDQDNNQENKSTENIKINNQKQQERINQQNISNPKQQPQRQNQQKVQRKSTDAKTSIKNIQQKKPIQKQQQQPKQNVQRSQNQQTPTQKYQKRQTLDPKNSTKISPVKRNNVTTTKRPTQQNKTRRKTTFNENHMITKQRENNLNTTKTRTTTSNKNTTTTRQRRLQSPQKTAIQRSPAQKQQQSKSSTQKIQQRSINSIQDSIFGFQKVLSKKLSTIHSNSIGTSIQESQSVFSPPSLSESEVLFCNQTGININELDLFSKKLVIRRLKKAIKEGTGSISIIKKFRDAFRLTFGEENSFSEIGIDDCVSLLSTRMQALTDKSGEHLFLCELDTPIEDFKNAVNEKDKE